MNTALPDEIWKQKQICHVLKISRTTLWRFRQNPSFPSAIKLGPRSIGWRAVDIVNWIESQPRIS